MKQFYFKVFISIWLVGFALNGQAQTTNDNGVVIARTQKVNDVKIFPNPAIDRFTINMPHSSIKYITINNIIGKEVKKLRASSSKSYEISDLKRGVYIIRIFDTNEELVKALRLSKT